MSAHSILQDLYAGGANVILDPGASGTILLKERSHGVVEIVTAAAESRTLPAPTVSGAVVTLAMKTDGGDCTITVTGGYDELGSTTLVLGDAGEFYTFRSVRTAASTYVWRLTASHLLGGLAVTGNRFVNVTDAATYTVLAANTGKTHIIPNLTADCTITLPTAAAGLEYTFIGKAVAADAQSWIFSTGGANFFIGGLGFADTDDPADTIAVVFPNGSSNDFMTILAPAGGTRIHLVCDGTNWIVNGTVIGATAPTFSDT